MIYNNYKILFNILILSVTVWLASGIYSGKRTKFPNFQYVVRLSHNKPENSSGPEPRKICTGVQLNELWILTTKNCISKNGTTIVYTRNFEKVSGLAPITRSVRTNDKDMNHLVMAKLLYPNSHFQRMKYALLPSHPVNMSHKLNMNCTTVGYSKEESGDYILRETNVITAPCLNTSDDLNEFCARATGHRTCGPAEGGPIICKGVVYGLMSQWTASTCEPQQLFYYINVYPYTDFISVSMVEQNITSKSTKAEPHVPTKFLSIVLFIIKFILL